MVAGRSTFNLNFDHEQCLLSYEQCCLAVCIHMPTFAFDIKHKFE